MMPPAARRNRNGKRRLVDLVVVATTGRKNRRRRRRAAAAVSVSASVCASAAALTAVSLSLLSLLVLSPGAAAAAGAASTVGADVGVSATAMDYSPSGGDGCPRDEGRGGWEEDAADDDGGYYSEKCPAPPPLHPHPPPSLSSSSFEDDGDGGGGGGDDRRSTRDLGAAVAAAAATAATPPPHMAIRGGGSGSGSSSDEDYPLVGSHLLVRILFLRGLSFVYFVAFLVAYHQNRALIGDDGITPCRRILWDAELRGRKKAQLRRRWMEDRKKYRNPGSGEGDEGWMGKVKNWTVVRAVGDALNSCDLFDRAREVLWDRTDAMNRPLISLFWLVRDRRKMDIWLDGVALGGMATAIAVFVLGAANVPLLFGLWLCQRSFMSVGGLWYGYGWEPQLAELGFHALFLVPLRSLSPVASTPPPLAVIFAIRWYLFRIMLGAGLIKLKSRDVKWKYPHLNAMHVFYETQPVPNMFTRYFHAMPGWWHKFEVMVNHVVELALPFLLILPGLGRRWRLCGGLVQIGFQGLLILSGNLSFLNWLTALPGLLCLDDLFVSHLFNSRLVSAASEASSAHRATATMFTSLFGTTPLRQLITLSFTTLIATLSVPVIKNLLARRQYMNASFDRLRLVNTYGAFGTVSDNRDELIIESAMDLEGPWREYEFKVKPGDVFRRPRWISPYHYRLDWQIWIASCGRSIERSPWLLKLMLKILRGDGGVRGLLAGDPWAPPPASSSASSKSPSPSPSASHSEGRGSNGGGGGGDGAADADAVEDTSDSSGSEEDERGGDEGGGGGDDDDASKARDKEAGNSQQRPRFIRIVKYRYKFNYDKDDDNEAGDGRRRQRPYWKRERIGKFFPRQGTALTEDMLSEYIS